MADNEEKQDFGVFGMGLDTMRRQFVLGVVFVLVGAVGYLEVLRWQSQKQLIDQIEKKNREIIECKLEQLQTERAHGKEIEKLLIQQAQTAAKVVNAAKRNKR